MTTRTHERGISTAEILVGVMLSLLVLGILYSFQRWQYFAFARQATYVESQNLTRNVMDTLTRELRMAAFDPTAAALPAAETFIRHGENIRTWPQRRTFSPTRPDS